MYLTSFLLCCTTYFSHFLCSYPAQSAKVTLIYNHKQPVQNKWVNNFLLKIIISMLKRQVLCVRAGCFLHDCPCRKRAYLSEPWTCGADRHGSDRRNRHSIVASAMSARQQEHAGKPAHRHKASIVVYLRNQSKPILVK